MTDNFKTGVNRSAYDIEETRSLSFDEVFGRLGKDSFGMNLTGSFLDPDKVPALNQSIRIITDGISTLPLGCESNPLIDDILFNPNAEQNSVEFISVIVSSLLWNANAYIEKLYDSRGVLVGLMSHHYRQISVERIHNAHRYRYTDIYGNTRVILDSEMIHIRYQSDDKVFGVSPVQQCRESIEIAIAQQRFMSSYNANGSNTGGTLETDKTMSPEAVQNLSNAWETRHKGVDNANRVSVLHDGMKYKIKGHDMVQSDFIRAYTMFAIEEVSRIMNIPPSMLNDWRYNTYTNSAEAKRTLYDVTLRPWMTLIENAINKGLGLPRGMAVKFDPSQLLRMSPLDQAKTALDLMNAGVVTVNEWREKNGYEPIEGGDVLLSNQSGGVQNDTNSNT